MLQLDQVLEIYNIYNTLSILVLINTFSDTGVDDDNVGNSGVDDTSVVDDRIDDTGVDADHIWGALCFVPTQE